MLILIAMWLVGLVVRRRGASWKQTFLAVVLVHFAVAYLFLVLGLWS